MSGIWTRTMRSKTLRAPQTLQTTLGFLIACGSPWAPSCSKDAISHQGWLLCSLPITSLSCPRHLSAFYSSIHIHLCPAMVHIGYFEPRCFCCPSSLVFHFTALFSHFFVWNLTPMCIHLFWSCMLAVMLCIHRITYIHHAEGCKMHRGHYISFKVAAWLPHDSWRATVFLLHVPFYGHQLGAYNVFCAYHQHHNCILYFSI